MSDDEFGDFDDNYDSGDDEEKISEERYSQDPNDQSPPDLKIILLGDSAVGKSKLVERFLMEDYTPRQDSTYALTVYRYNYSPEGKIDEKTGEQKTYAIDFWDTAGQERFSSMHPSYYDRADACILVFDCVRRPTYENLKKWHGELMKYRKRVPVLLCANKIDLKPRVVNTKYKFAVKKKIPLHFASAADGTNVVSLFNAAMAAAVKSKAAGPRDFMESLYDTLDYFDQKEADAQKAADGN